MKTFETSLLLLALLLAGCSSYVSRTEPGHSATNYQHFFVKSNFDDNHGIDGRIVQALQDRGLKAEKGPLTLLPREAQAIITYEDQWNWDFKTHLTGLRLFIADARTEKRVASGTFNGPAAMFTSTDEAIDRLLQKVLKSAAEAKPAK